MHSCNFYFPFIVTHSLALQHFKDLINIRRTEGEILRKLPAKDSGSSSSSEKSHSEDELETNISVSREKCLPVVHGLISLLLSMDFTCNVDLFVIACKVGASSVVVVATSRVTWISSSLRAR